MVSALGITGERYGRLIAVRRVQNRGRRTVWLFECDCGNSKEISLEAVRRGLTQSCGCIRKEENTRRSTKHGHSIGQRSRTWRAWQHAKGRCLNPHDPKFPIYGGRGITMCERWRNDFRAFLADMGECPPGKTLDRINPHGNYEPANCRWATSHEQARTRTDNVLVKHQGATLVLKDYATAIGVDYKALHSRIRYYGQSTTEAAMGLLRREANP
jgi:hypothetical protein